MAEWSLESILGLLKSLKIRAQIFGAHSKSREGGWRKGLLFHFSFFQGRLVYVSVDSLFDCIMYIEETSSTNLYTSTCLDQNTPYLACSIRQNQIFIILGSFGGNNFGFFYCTSPPPPPPTRDPFVIYNFFIWKKGGRSDTCFQFFQNLFLLGWIDEMNRFEPNILYHYQYVNDKNTYLINSWEGKQQHKTLSRVEGSLVLNQKLLYTCFWLQGNSCLMASL
jgi:hypothetical protein